MKSLYLGQIGIGFWNLEEYGGWSCGCEVHLYRHTVWSLWLEKEEAEDGVVVASGGGLLQQRSLVSTKGRLLGFLIGKPFLFGQP